MMAKKSSAKASKKPVKPAKTPARVQRSAAITGSGKPLVKAKYQQAGAPWWKQFLPG